MKRIFLLIPPLVLLGVFVYFFQLHQKETEIQKAKDAEVAKVAAVAEKARLDALREKSAAEAKAAAELKALKEKEEADKAQAKKDEEERKTLEKIDAALTDANRYKAEIARLQKDIQKARDTLDNLQRDAVAMEIEVETALAQKRRAELEIQRLTENLVMRADQARTALVAKPAASKAN